MALMPREVFYSREEWMKITEEVDGLERIIDHEISVLKKEEKLDDRSVRIDLPKKPSSAVSRELSRRYRDAGWDSVSIYSMMHRTIISLVCETL